MKIAKKILSVTLCLMLLLGVVAVGGGGFAGLFPKAEATSTFKKSDVVYFGSYPQSNVKDEALIEQLNSQSAQWHSYEYVSGTGTGIYNRLTQSDYIVSDFCIVSVVNRCCPQSQNICTVVFDNFIRSYVVA